MIAHLIANKDTLLKQAQRVVTDFCKNRGINLVPVIYKQLAISGYYDSTSKTIYIASELYRKFQEETVPERAFFEFMRLLRHEAEHYRRDITGRSQDEREVERTAIIAAARTLEANKTEKVNPLSSIRKRNPLLEAAITGLGFGAGLMAAKSVFKNPNEPPHLKEAFEARARYKSDVKADHTAAAEYWRGQAGAYFTANPSLKDYAYRCSRCGEWVNKANQVAHEMRDDYREASHKLMKTRIEELHRDLQKTTDPDAKNPLFSPKPLKFGTQVLVKIGRRMTPGQIQNYSKGWYRVKTPIGVLTASSSEVMLNPSGLDEIAERRYLIEEIKKHIKEPFAPQFLTTEQLRQVLRRVRS